MLLTFQAVYGVLSGRFPRPNDKHRSMKPGYDRVKDALQTHARALTV